MEKQELVGLVNKWKTGDENAYKQINSYFHDRFVNNIMEQNGFSASVANEIVDKAMFKACLNIQQLDDPSMVEIWLMSLVKEKAIEHIPDGNAKTTSAIDQLDALDYKQEKKVISQVQKNNKKTVLPKKSISKKSKFNIFEKIIAGVVATLIIITGGIIYFNIDNSLDENDDTLLLGFMKTDAHDKAIEADKQAEADKEAEDQKEIDSQRNNLSTVENSAYASRVDQINKDSLFKMSEKADEYMNDKFEQVSYLGDYVRYTTSSMPVTLESGSLREEAENVTIDYNYYGRLYSFVEGGKTYYYYIEFYDVRKDGAELDLDNIYSEVSYRMWDDLDLLKKNKEDYSSGINWNF